MAVEDGIRPVRADRAREPPRAEECPDALRLADERLRHRRVVEEHEPSLAPCDRLQPGLHGLDLPGRLGVHLAQQRLPEVRDLRAREPAHEPLRADHPHLEPCDLENGVAAVEHDDARLREGRRDLGGERAVVVVVAEHGEHGNIRAPARVPEHARLVDEAVRGEVAGEQDQVGLGADLRERPLEPGAQLLGGMDVSYRGNRDAGHVAPYPAAGSRYPEPGYTDRMPYTPSDVFPELIETMKKAASALSCAEVEFLLGGGLAAWARGGPPTDHDVDLMVRQADVERAADALRRAGMRIEHPPEGWLVKAWDGDVLVDLIFRPAGGPVDDGYFERASREEVSAMPILVASLDDVLATKLLAMSEQEPDFRPVLEIARSLREQIDWDSVRAQVEDSPFGAAFLTLVERLRILPDSVEVPA
jgi:Nucleotidyl transferase of unknown function (DUF2204)